MNLYNPSLDLSSLVRRLHDAGQKAVVAVAPAVEQQQHASEHTRSSASPSSSPDEDQHHDQFSSFERRKRPAHSGKGKGGAEEGSSGKRQGEESSEPEHEDETATIGAELEGLGPSLAAQDFSSWLVDELGGPDRSDKVYDDMVEVVA